MKRTTAQYWWILHLYLQALPTSSFTNTKKTVLAYLKSNVMTAASAGKIKCNSGVNLSYTIITHQTINGHQVQYYTACKRVWCFMLLLMLKHMFLVLLTSSVFQGRQKLWRLSDCAVTECNANNKTMVLPWLE